MYITYLRVQQQEFLPGRGVGYMAVKFHKAMGIDPIRNCIWLVVVFQGGIAWQSWLHLRRSPSVNSHVGKTLRAGTVILWRIRQHLLYCLRAINGHINVGWFKGVDRQALSSHLLCCLRSLPSDYDASFVGKVIRRWDHWRIGWIFCCPGSLDSELVIVVIGC